MDADIARYRGCLLGMAAGDAMGAAVDSKRYVDICQTYGPSGLLGYDLANGKAEITSYTQVTLFACNGMLLSISRGQVGMKSVMLYISLALKEWAKVQHLPGSPERRYCWLSRVPKVRSRRCMDPRTLDSLTRDVLGTPRRPANQGAGPGTLPAAVAAGLFFHPDRMGFQEIGALGANIVALTHGDPTAFLSGAVLAYLIAGTVQDPDCSTEEQVMQAAQVVAAQFPCPQADKLQMMLRDAVVLSKRPEVPCHKAMERLECTNAAQVLAGAVYAVLVSGDDFDAAMIAAVNHSGKSAAVGAVAGAIMGAKLGDQPLPEFYLGCLEAADTVCTVAQDLYTALPKGLRTRLFDDEWDRKYTQGLPPEQN